jgi:hypothetical protein
MNVGYAIAHNMMRDFQLGYEAMWRQACIDAVLAPVPGDRAAVS